MCVSAREFKSPLHPENGRPTTIDGLIFSPSSDTDQSSFSGRYQPLKDDDRPAAQTSGVERSLCIGCLLRRIFPCDAQLDFARFDHAAQLFKPLGTLERLHHEYRRDPDSWIDRLVSPAANRQIDAPVTKGIKRTL